MKPIITKMKPLLTIIQTKLITKIIPIIVRMNLQLKIRPMILQIPKIIPTKLQVIIKLKTILKIVIVQAVIINKINLITTNVLFIAKRDIAMGFIKFG